MNPDEIAARISAGQELRRRGKLSAEQDAALRELERRYPGDSVNLAMAAGDTASARIVAEEQEALHNAPVVSSGAGRTWEPTARAAGEEAARNAGPVRGPVSAAIQGAGSLAFGAGTPITAAGEYVGSRIRGEPRSLADSFEFAGGFREGAKEEHPVAYTAGAVGGLVGSGSAVRQAVRKAPAVVRNVFSLQAGQTVRNLARMSAAGATASGVTAGLQEGTDAIAPAAAVGAVAGPVAGVLASGVVRGARYVGSKINPDNAAIRILSKRLGESANDIAARYNSFVQTMGRRPRLIEIMRREAAEEMGQVSASKVGVGAGRVFREAEEAASTARPGELRAQIESGGRTTTLPEQTAELAPITSETRATVGRRVHPNSTEAAHLARRDRAMDVVMNRIGNHRVYLTDDMREVIEDPDVQSALPGALRRRIHNALEQGETLGTIDLSVRTWEMMRQALAGKSGAGTGQIYSRLRDKVRDYVGEHVPEYSAALKEFGRRSSAAASITSGRDAVQKSTHEFADVLRDATPSEKVGVRKGVRAWLSNQLSGPPQQAERIMARLARDNRLRSNLRTALSDREIKELEALGERYGHRLNIIEGVKIGQRVVTGDADRFADAVREAGTKKGGEIGVRTGARGALAAKAGESPAAATAVASAVGDNPGLLQRITAALGGREAARLQQVGQTTSSAARNLAAAAPRRNEAQARLSAEAAQIQEAITGAVIVAGRSSGALRANFLNNIQQRMRFSEKTATRLAEMAVDPNQAHVFINRMRAAGVQTDELLRWYRDAAVAAGITTGANVKAN